MASRSMFLGTLALIALMRGCAALETAGIFERGWTYASGIEGYLNMSMDVCDMIAAVQPDGAGFDVAKDIFMNGKNSASTPSQNRAHHLWATADHEGERAYDALMARFPTKDYLSTEVQSALDNNEAMYFQTLLNAARFKYCLHEVDAAIRRTALGLVENATGAPHNLDEAWAIWAHAGPCNGGDLVQVWHTIGGLAMTNVQDTSAGLMSMAFYFNHMMSAMKETGVENITESYNATLMNAMVFIAQYATAQATQSRQCQDHEGVPVEELKKSAIVLKQMATGLLELFGAPAETIQALDDAEDKPKLIDDAFKQVFAEWDLLLLYGKPRDARYCMY